MEKTAMEQLIEYIEKFTPKNKTTDGIWSKAKSLIEIEKQQIIDAHGNKKKHARDTGNYQYTYTGEMYFNDNYY
jgi:hypothetical protein